MPEERRRRVLIPIYKNNGDQQCYGNYRGIKLMSHTMKIWERIIEARQGIVSLSLSLSLFLFHQIKIHERNKMQNKAIWNVGKEHRGTFRFSKSRCSLRKKENYKIEKRNKRVKQ